MKVKHLCVGSILILLLVVFSISSCTVSQEPDLLKEAAVLIANQLGLPETSQSTEDRFIIFYAAELETGDVVSEGSPSKDVSR